LKSNVRYENLKLIEVESFECPILQQNANIYFLYETAVKGDWNKVGVVREIMDTLRIALNYLTTVKKRLYDAVETHLNKSSECDANINFKKKSTIIARLSRLQISL
jgi:hypothetical protein